MEHFFHVFRQIKGLVYKRIKKRRTNLLFVIDSANRRGHDKTNTANRFSSVNKKQTEKDEDIADNVITNKIQKKSVKIDSK